MDGRPDAPTPGALAGAQPADGVLAREAIHTPPLVLPGLPARAWLAVRSLALSPAYGWLARREGVPGFGWRRISRRVAFALARRGGAGLPWSVPYRLLAFPMDSTRYFEFDAMGRWLPDGDRVRYLDVSSPRLFPLGTLLARKGWTAELVNPDPRDLAVTRAMVGALGLAGRCGLHDCTIDRAPWPDASFDLVTCISVLEHIPDDAGALRTMWRLLRPRGRLLLTVPCAAAPLEQYIDHNEFGVLRPAADGVVFWQRFYDEAMLADRVFAVTGPPARAAFYGERVAGSFQANAARKRADPLYPMWREPLMMAREYQAFPSPAVLPGEGVAALELVKA